MVQRLCNVISGMIIMINLNGIAGNLEYSTSGSFHEQWLYRQDISVAEIPAPTHAKASDESFQENSDGIFSIDIFPLPILFGEYGLQCEVKVMEALNVGIHFAYFDPTIGIISNSMIGSFIEPEDAITIDAKMLIPGISCTHYFKKPFEGFYLGGLLLYKNGSGDILFDDKYSGELTNRAIIQTAIKVSSVSFNVNTGYRFVLGNGLSFRVGGGLGLQIGSDKTTYTILQEYSAGEGLKSTADLKDVLHLYYDTVVKPVSYFLMLGIGKTF